MYYRERKDALPDKEGNHLWRPELVTSGKVIDTRTLSKPISTATTLTEADISAVLLSLSQFMNTYLREGHTIRLDGLGTFSVYGRSKGKGVLTKDEVRPSQFTSLICKFTPEYKVSVGGTRTRTLLDGIQFTHIDRLLGNKTAGNNNGTGNNDDDDDFVDPTL